MASNVLISTRGIRHVHFLDFRAPWPFVKKGRFGQRKIGPFNYEKHKWPGQDREFPELSPKWQKLNPPELHRYTGVQPEGYVDSASGKFVPVPEMKTELVVPNLEGFQLKPYVSFRTDIEIEKRRRAYSAKLKQHGSQEVADLHTLEEERWPIPKMTAETLFELHYAKHIRDSYKEGKYKLASSSKPDTPPNTTKN